MSSAHFATKSEYTDSTTGNVNMAARWYNPATGDFLSRDTQLNNPVPNSVDANPFTYGNDDPLTGIDPSGHRPLESNDATTPGPSLGSLIGHAFVDLLDHTFLHPLVTAARKIYTAIKAVVYVAKKIAPYIKRRAPRLFQAISQSFNNVKHAAQTAWLNVVPPKARETLAAVSRVMTAPIDVARAAAAVAKANADRQTAVDYLYFLNSVAWSMGQAEQDHYKYSGALDPHIIGMVTSPHNYCEANNFESAGCGKPGDPVFNAIFGDAIRCYNGGSSSSCTLAAVTFLPAGKLAKMATEGEKALVAARVAGDIAGSTKEIPIVADSFEGARNAALDLLGQIDEATRTPVEGKFGIQAGRTVGFTTKVDGVPKMFRMDFDPVKGTNINITIGKGGDAVKYAVHWPGTEADLDRLLGRNAGS